jgi:NodT family efflux transporter outer membrane factor (OMF) lipoprotein
MAGVDRPATPLAHWWQRFDDPLMVALIDDALRVNTTVRGARAALARSRAALDVQSAALLPALRGSASAQRNRTGDVTGNAFRVGFDASWEPAVFGGQQAAVMAAEAEARASSASLADVQVSVAAEVAVNALHWRGLRARLALARASLAAQEETLQLTQWRQQAGLLSEIEVNQARTGTEQTRAQLPSLLTSISESESSLAVLTGRDPAAMHDRLAAAIASTASVSSPQPTPPADLVLAFPVDALRQRPDVRAAEALLIAAGARMAQADAARWPRFELGGTLGLGARTVGALTNGTSAAAALLASLSASIFDGGAARAQVRVQQAALEQAAASYDAALLAALKDVEDSLAALRNDRDRLQSLRDAAMAARSASELAAERFRSGLIDFQVVLDTQRADLSTQDAVASALATLNADHVRLYKALGGGWEASSVTGLAGTGQGTSLKPRIP